MTIQDMAAALAARDAGMSSSAEHAENVMPGWQDEVVRAVIGSVYLQNEPEWTMHHARQWLYACGLPIPAEERAWGAATVRLIREGIIEKTGQYAPAASSNGSAKPLYRRKGRK